MAPGCGTPQSEAQAGSLHQQSGAKTELKKPLSLLEAPPGQHSRHSQPHVQTHHQLHMQLQPLVQSPAPPPAQPPAQPQLLAEAKEGVGRTSTVSTSDTVGRCQSGLSKHVDLLLARIAQLHGNDTMQQEYQRVQDAEDVQDFVRELTERYAPELKKSFGDFVFQSYQEKEQMHAQELKDRILRRNGHDTIQIEMQRIVDKGKTYSDAVRELTAEYAPELTDNWEDIVRKAVSMVAFVRETAAVDAVTYIHTYMHTHVHTYTQTNIQTCINEHMHMYMHTHIHTHAQTPFPITPLLRAVWCISTRETDIYYNQQEAHKASTQQAASPGYSACPNQVTLYM